MLRLTLQADGGEVGDGSVVPTSSATCHIILKHAYDFLANGHTGVSTLELGIWPWYRHKRRSVQHGSAH